VEDPRTLQANERTLLAWLRTGLSLVTFGFVIGKTAVWVHLDDNDLVHTGRATRIGTAFIFLGVAAEVIGLIRYVRVKKALLAHREAPTGATEVVVLAVVFGLLGALLGVSSLIAH
jgi:inner membrane protein YidH